jgi:hypothetical protein
LTTERLRGHAADIVNAEVAQFAATIKENLEDLEV